MLLTEEEAKKKDCCISDGDAGRPYCNASGCMGWRWGEDAEQWVWEEKYSDTGKGKGHYEPAKNRRGFCGIAGEVKRP